MLIDFLAGLFIYDEDEEEGKGGKKKDVNLYDGMPYDYLDENMDVAQKLEQQIGYFDFRTEFSK